MSETNYLVEKGELRWGTSFEPSTGNPMTKYKHWHCVTTKVLNNVKAKIDSAEDLNGFDSLTDEDKEKIKSAWDAGEMPPKPAPAEASEDDAQDEGNGLRKSKPRGAKTAAAAKKEAAAAKKEPAKRKKTKADEEDKESAEGTESDEESKPKNKKAAPKKKESAEGTESDEESKPKKKKAAPKKKAAAAAKAPAKKKAAPKKKAGEEEA
ncbi:hypothetical protein HDU87_006319 [Geranomyces variabilis]|uniref:PARP-type domain-containing protein n=1 Tax=Geranomyces variabilis TaxID=109894 RepID=A0AAD5THV0_9FUNG|nr:hypothetical protein HDU87_006319 [Geranomyces variabilis]